MKPQSRPSESPFIEPPFTESGPSAPRAGARPLAGMLALVVAAGIGWGVYTRLDAREALRRQSDALSVTPVVVTRAQAAPGGGELVLPGTVSAWRDAPLYARTSGYLKRWLVDIGQHVKAGQLMAEIDAPDVDQQLRQAQADRQSAEAANDLAQSTARRWRAMLAQDSVSRQDADSKIADARAKQAALASAQANVQRLSQLQGFERITAPFDGVVTQRNVDVGALIDAGANAPQALFRVADARRLRIYVQVPEAQAGAVHVGGSAELHVAGQPGVTYPAKVIATAAAIDPATRTLLTQLEADNAHGQLLAGAYAEVHFKLPARTGVLRVPADALLFRPEGVSVAVVDVHHQIVITPITLGRDFGQEVEVTAGLKPDDLVVVDPPDSASTGDAVRVTKEMPAN